MFKFTPLRLHCSNLITPAANTLSKKRVKKCPLNKTARNLYVTYITLAITLPFTISYMHNLNSKGIFSSNNNNNSNTLLIEENINSERHLLNQQDEELNAPVKKRQHSVRYIF
ncbi:hypothetical protein HANVADRAFT_51768 [Hanseniaspora valbyensis NRRL Y-1626]|uniref:Uncharacterized protein n=1 Tax=Hanseniaspora valbyensis NRRL Y-1626 TaxID=766949 RepID=A0A1B7TH94_9ASCO|nr:hypothetical protein HANVADRAFT_51768 [Hanseniaspora valbyensis NRRL Y-1626]